MSLFDFLVPGRRQVKLTDPAGWILDRGSAAGRTVNAGSALSLSTAWSCVRLLSETVGTLPIGAFRIQPDGSRAPALDHPLQRLVHLSPNAEQSAAEFWEAVTACLALWGNAYAEKIKGPRGDLVALNFMRPDQTTVRRNAEGARIYDWRPGKAPAITLAEDQVFHLRGFGVGGDVGLSPVAYARESMGSALAAEEAAGGLLANGLQQPLMIDSGQVKLTTDQRQQLTDLFKKFAGSHNAGKVMVLEAGMKPIPLTFNPDDAQFLQTRAFQVEEICRWFRVPPFMVGHTSASTSWGTGLEQQLIAFLTFSLRPYLTRIEQAIKMQLLSPADRAAGVYAEFNLDGLLRADSDARAKFYAMAGQNGWMTRNEIRRKENLEPDPAEAADQLTVQSNLVPLNKLGQAPAVPTQPAPGEPAPPAPIRQ